MLFRASAVLVVAALAGCAAPKAVSLRAFDSEAAMNALKPGTNTIRGSALIRQRGGTVVTCAGREVTLIPVTDHAVDRMDAIYGHTGSGYLPAFPQPRLVFQNEHPGYKYANSTTTCDAQGFFKFDRVADGEFFVVTVITWQVTSYIPEGGSLMQRVRVSGGESREIVLTSR